MADLRDMLKISSQHLDAINALMSDPGNEIVTALLQLVERYGGPQEINRRARAAGSLDRLMMRLEEIKSPYLQDLEWLKEQQDRRAFISMADYVRKVGGPAASAAALNQFTSARLRNERGGIVWRDYSMTHLFDPDFQLL